MLSTFSTSLYPCLDSLAFLIIQIYVFYMLAECLKCLKIGILAGFQAFSCLLNLKSLKLLSLPWNFWWEIHLNGGLDLCPAQAQDKPDNKPRPSQTHETT